MEESKTFDLEETREETAKRLIKQRLESFEERNSALRERGRRHGRYLSPGDREALVNRLRRETEATIRAIEDTGGEAVEFFWPTDVNPVWEETVAK